MRPSHPLSSPKDQGLKVGQKSGAATATFSKKELEHVFGEYDNEKRKQGYLSGGGGGLGQGGSRPNRGGAYQPNPDADRELIRSLRQNRLKQANAVALDGTDIDVQRTSVRQKGGAISGAELPTELQETPLKDVLITTEVPLDAGETRYLTGKALGQAAEGHLHLHEVTSDASQQGGDDEGVNTGGGRLRFLDAKEERDQYFKSIPIRAQQLTSRANDLVSAAVAGGGGNDEWDGKSERHNAETSGDDSVTTTTTNLHKDLLKPPSMWTGPFSAVGGNKVSTEADREAHEERLYLEYMKLQDQVDEYEDYRRAVGVDTFEGNFLGIQALLAGEKADRELLGDWDTFNKVEDMLKQFVFRKAPNDAALDEGTDEQSSASKKFVEKLKEKLHRSREMIDSLNNKVRSLTSALTVATKESKSFQVLSKEQGSELARMRALNTTLMQQLRQMKNTRILAKRGSVVISSSLDVGGRAAGNETAKLQATIQDLEGQLTTLRSDFVDIANANWKTENENRSLKLRVAMLTKSLHQAGAAEPPAPPSAVAPNVPRDSEVTEATTVALSAVQKAPVGVSREEYVASQQQAHTRAILALKKGRTAWRRRMERQSEDGLAACDLDANLPETMRQGEMKLISSREAALFQLAARQRGMNLGPDLSFGANKFRSSVRKALEHHRSSGHNTAADAEKASRKVGEGGESPEVISPEEANLAIMAWAQQMAQNDDKSSAWNVLRQNILGDQMLSRAEILRREEAHLSKLRHRVAMLKEELAVVSSDRDFIAINYTQSEHEIQDLQTALAQVNAKAEKIQRELFALQDAQSQVQSLTTKLKLTSKETTVSIDEVRGVLASSANNLGASKRSTTTDSLQRKDGIDSAAPSEPSREEVEALVTIFNHKLKALEEELTNKSSELNRLHRLHDEGGTSPSSQGGLFLPLGDPSKASRHSGVSFFSGDVGGAQVPQHNNSVMYGSAILGEEGGRDQSITMIAAGSSVTQQLLFAQEDVARLEKDITGKEAVIHEYDRELKRLKLTLAAAEDKTFEERSARTFNISVGTAARVVGKLRKKAREARDRLYLKQVERRRQDALLRRLEEQNSLIEQYKADLDDARAVKSIFDGQPKTKHELAREDQILRETERVLLKQILALCTSDLQRKDTRLALDRLLARDEKERAVDNFENGLRDTVDDLDDVDDQEMSVLHRTNRARRAAHAEQHAVATAAQAIPAKDMSSWCAARKCWLKVILSREEAWKNAQTKEARAAAQQRVVEAYEHMFNFEQLGSSSDDQPGMLWAAALNVVSFTGAPISFGITAEEILTNEASPPSSDDKDTGAKNAIGKPLATTGTTPGCTISAEELDRTIAIQRKNREEVTREYAALKELVKSRATQLLELEAKRDEIAGQISSSGALTLTSTALAPTATSMPSTTGSTDTILNVVHFPTVASESLAQAAAKYGIVDLPTLRSIAQRHLLGGASSSCSHLPRSRLSFVQVEEASRVPDARLRGQFLKPADATNHPSKLLGPAGSVPQSMMYVPLYTPAQLQALLQAFEGDSTLSNLSEGTDDSIEFVIRHVIQPHETVDSVASLYHVPTRNVRYVGTSHPLSTSHERRHREDDSSSRQDVSASHQNNERPVAEGSSGDETSVDDGNVVLTPTTAGVSSLNPVAFGPAVTEEDRWAHLALIQRRLLKIVRAVDVRVPSDYILKVLQAVHAEALVDFEMGTMSPLAAAPDESSVSDADLASSSSISRLPTSHGAGPATEGLIRLAQSQEYRVRGPNLVLAAFVRPPVASVASIAAVLNVAPEELVALNISLTTPLPASVESDSGEDEEGGSGVFSPQKPSSRGAGVATTSKLPVTIPISITEDNALHVIAIAEASAAFEAAVASLELLMTASQQKLPVLERPTSGGAAHSMMSSTPPYTLPELIILHEVAIGDTFDSVGKTYGLSKEYLRRYLDRRSFEVAMRAVQIPIVGSDSLLSILHQTSSTSSSAMSPPSPPGVASTPVAAMLRSVQSVYHKLFTREALLAEQSYHDSSSNAQTLSQAGVSESVAQWLRSPAMGNAIRVSRPTGISNHPLVDPDCPTVQGIAGLSTWVAAYPVLPAVVFHDGSTGRSMSTRQGSTLKANSQSGFGSSRSFAVEVMDRTTLGQVAAAVPGLLREFTFLPNLTSAMRKSSVMSWVVRLRSPAQLRRVVALGLHRCVYTLVRVDGVTIPELLASINNSLNRQRSVSDAHPLLSHNALTANSAGTHPAVVTANDIILWNPEISTLYSWSSKRTPPNTDDLPAPWSEEPPADSCSVSTGKYVVEGALPTTSRYTGYLRVPMKIYKSQAEAPTTTQLDEAALSSFLRLGGEVYVFVDAEVARGTTTGATSLEKLNSVHIVSQRLWCRSEADVQAFECLLDPLSVHTVVILPRSIDGTKLVCSTRERQPQLRHGMPVGSMSLSPGEAFIQLPTTTPSMPSATTPWLIRFEYHSPNVVLPLRVPARCSKIRTALERDIYEILSHNIPKRREREAQLNRQTSMSGTTALSATPQKKGGTSASYLKDLLTSPMTPVLPLGAVPQTMAPPPPSVLGVSVIAVRPNNRAIIWVTVASFEDAKVAIDLLANEGAGCPIPHTHQAMTLSKTQETTFLGNVSFYSITSAAQPTKDDSSSNDTRSTSVPARTGTNVDDAINPGLMPLRFNSETDAHVLFFKDHRRFESSAVAAAGNGADVNVKHSSSGSSFPQQPKAGSGTAIIGTTFLSRLTLNSLVLETGISCNEILAMNPDLASLLLTPNIVASLDQSPAALSISGRILSFRGAQVCVSPGDTLVSIAKCLIDAGVVAASGRHGPISNSLAAPVSPTDEPLNNRSASFGSGSVLVHTSQNTLTSNDMLSTEEALLNAVVQELRYENCYILPIAAMVPILRVPVRDASNATPGSWKAQPSPSLHPPSSLSPPTSCRLSRTITGGSLLAVSMQFGVEVHAVVPSTIHLVSGSCLKVPRHCSKTLYRQQPLAAAGAVVERVVLRGDTITSIAAEFGLTPRELALCNATLVKIPAGALVQLPYAPVLPRHLGQYQRTLEGSYVGGGASSLSYTNFRQTYTGFMIRHAVSSSDTLTSICNRYNQSLLGILSANPHMLSIAGAHFLLVPLDDYHRDEALSVRCCSLFTVVATTAFDSINSYARQFNVTVSDILEATKLMVGHASAADTSFATDQLEADVASKQQVGNEETVLAGSMRASTRFNDIASASLSLNTLPLNKKVIIPLTSSQGRALAHRQHLNIYVGIEVRPGESIVSVADRFNVYAKDVLVLGKRVQGLRVTHVDVPVSAELAMRFEVERKEHESRRKAPGISSAAKDNIPRYRTIFQLGSIGGPGIASGGTTSSAAATHAPENQEVQEVRKREFLETLWGVAPPSLPPSATHSKAASPISKSIPRPPLSSSPQSLELVGSTSRAPDVSSGSGAVRIDNINEEMVARLQGHEVLQKQQNASLQSKVQVIMHNINQLSSRYEATQRELQSVEEVHAAVVAREANLKRQRQLAVAGAEGKGEEDDGVVLFAFNMECVGTQTNDCVVVDADYVSPVRVPLAVSEMQTTLTSLEMDVIDAAAQRSEEAAQTARQELAAFKDKVRHLFDHKSAIEKEFEEIRRDHERLKQEKLMVEGELLKFKNTGRGDCDDTGVQTDLTSSSDGYSPNVPLYFSGTTTHQRQHEQDEAAEDELESSATALLSSSQRFRKGKRGSSLSAGKKGTSPSRRHSKSSKSGSPPSARASLSDPIQPNTLRTSKQAPRVSRPSVTAKTNSFADFARNSKHASEHESDDVVKHAPTPPSSPPPVAVSGRPSGAIVSTQRSPAERSSSSAPALQTVETNIKKQEKVTMLVASSAYYAPALARRRESEASHDSASPDGVLGGRSVSAGSALGVGAPLPSGIALPKLKTKIRATAGRLSATASNIRSDLQQLKKLTRQTFHDMFAYASFRLLPLCSDQFTVEDLNLRIEQLAVEQEAEIDKRVVMAASAIAASLGPHLTDLFTRVKRKKVATLRPFTKTERGIFTTTDEDNLTQEEWVSNRLSDFIQGAVEETLRINREEAATAAARQHQADLEDDERFYDYADARNTNPESIGLLLPRTRPVGRYADDNDNDESSGMKHSPLSPDDLQSLENERNALRRLKNKLAVDAEGKRRLHYHRDGLINAAARGAANNAKPGSPLSLVPRYPGDGVQNVKGRDVAPFLPDIHTARAVATLASPSDGPSNINSNSAFAKFAEAARTTSATLNYGRKHPHRHPNTQHSTIDEGDFEVHSDPHDDTACDDSGKPLRNWRVIEGGDPSIFDNHGRLSLRNRQGRRRSTTSGWAPAPIPQDVLGQVSKRRTTQAIINKVFLEMQSMLAQQVNNLSTSQQSDPAERITEESVITAAELARRRALSQVGTGISSDAIAALRTRDEKLREEGSKLLFRRVASQVKMRRLLDRLEAIEQEKTLGGSLPMGMPSPKGASATGHVTQLWRGWLKSWARRRKTVHEEREKNLQALAALFALGNLKRSLSSVAQQARSHTNAVLLQDNAVTGMESNAIMRKKASFYRRNGHLSRVESMKPPPVNALKQPSSFHFSSVRFHASATAPHKQQLPGVANPSRARDSSPPKDTPLVSPKPEKPLLLARAANPSQRGQRKHDDDSALQPHNHED